MNITDSLEIKPEKFCCSSDSARTFCGSASAASASAARSTH